MGGRGSGGSHNAGGKSSDIGNWEKTATGQWDIDVAGKGGAQILEGTDLYSRDKIFEVHMWDKDYKMLTKQVVATLTTAKSIVKNTLGIGKIK